MLLALIHAMFTQIFAFKNNSTYTLNNAEYQRLSLKKKVLFLYPVSALNMQKLSFLPATGIASFLLSPFPHREAKLLFGLHSNPHATKFSF